MRFLYKTTSLKQILADLGIKTLNKAQKRVMPDVYAGGDILAVMPTAGGKSLLYQIPAIYEQREKRGLTIVCSPPLALQRDQAAFLKQHDVAAVTRNSELPEKEREKILRNLDQFPVLFVTPEQLRKTDSREALKSVTVARVVVDEAHILPRAALEFRPAYGEIGGFIQQTGQFTQIMALTATATLKDQEYIIQSLGMRDPKIFRFPVRRKKLNLYVKRIAPIRGTGNKEDRLSDSFARAVGNELEKWNGKGRVIIYAPFRERAKGIRKWLKASGFKHVGLYTGDCGAKQRRKTMKRFQSGKIRVIVATSAFGLGINIPNVRLVIHAGLPQKTAPEKPRFITVGELLDEYVQLYGLNHWGDSCLSYSRHRIEHYIKPGLGEQIIQNLTAHDLDVFYNRLRETPAIILKGHKDTGKTVSTDVIRKVHDLLRSALNQAVAWGYIPTNPAENATLPRHKQQKRAVWSADEAKAALEVCEDDVLKLAMLLAVGCSMRIGEILGLTWDCVDISPESVKNGSASVFINKEIKRCYKSSLDDLSRRGHCDVIFTFPEWTKTDTSTALVLKAPKTESGIRRVFPPAAVANALRVAHMKQDTLKERVGDAWRDFNLVFAHDTGRPYEERQIAQKLRNFIREAGLPPVVFHSLRHCGTSIKLEISNGNIKAVRGDTGHAQSRMVTDVYAHTHDDVRRTLAKKVEKDFFQKGGDEPDSGVTSGDDLTSTAIQLLRENPNLAQPLIAAAQVQSPK